MKWRAWPEEKPKEDGIFLFRNQYKVYALCGYLKNGNGPCENLFSGDIYQWLDESDEAFEEMARERGYIKGTTRTITTVIDRDFRGVPPTALPDRVVSRIDVIS